VDTWTVEAATQRGVVVMNTPGATRSPPLRNFPFSCSARWLGRCAEAHASMTAGKWDRKLFQGCELSGKNLGRTRHGSDRQRSRQTRAGVSACGCWPTIPSLTEARAKALGVELVAEVDRVYREADFITVHLPVTDQTRHLLDADAFAKMKPGVRLVNCARGEIVKEMTSSPPLDRAKWRGRPSNVFAAEAVAGGPRLPQTVECDSHSHIRREHRRGSGKMRRRSGGGHHLPLSTDLAKCATP